MGDIADYIIDNIIDNACRLGDDLSDCDNYHDDFAFCKYCLEGDLLWVDTDYGWRLVDRKGKIHTCKNYKRRNK